MTLCKMSQETIPKLECQPAPDSNGFDVLRRDPSNNPPGMRIHIHRVIAQETDEGDAGALGQLDGEAGRGRNWPRLRNAARKPPAALSMPADPRAHGFSR